MDFEHINWSMPAEGVAVVPLSRPERRNTLPAARVDEVCAEAPEQERIDGEESGDDVRPRHHRVEAAHGWRCHAENKKEDEDKQQAPPIIRLGAGEHAPDERDFVGDATRSCGARHAEGNSD